MSYRLLNTPSVPSRWRLPTAPACHLSLPLHLGLRWDNALSLAPLQSLRAEVLVLLGSSGQVTWLELCPPDVRVLESSLPRPQNGTSCGTSGWCRCDSPGCSVSRGPRPAGLAPFHGGRFWHRGRHRGRRIPRVTLPQPGTCRKPGGGLQQSLAWPFAGAQPWPLLRLGLPAFRTGESPFLTCKSLSVRRPAQMAALTD